MNKEKFREVINLVQNTILDYTTIANRVGVSIDQVKDINKKYRIRISPYSAMYKHILKELKNGEKRSILASKYDIPYYTVNKIYRDNNINSIDMNEELNNRIIELYKEDYTIVNIAEELECSRNYISKYLLSIKARTKILRNKDREIIDKLKDPNIPLSEIYGKYSSNRVHQLARQHHINGKKIRK